MKWQWAIGSAEPERRLIRLGSLSPEIRKPEGRAMTAQQGAQRSAGYDAVWTQSPPGTMRCTHAMCLGSQNLTALQHTLV